MSEENGLNRRSLIKIVGLGSIAGGAVAATVKAAVAAESQMESAGGETASLGSFVGKGVVYFTEQEPGRWRGKEGSHVPRITATKKESGHMISVETPHEMKGFEHYIVKHVLIDKAFNVMGEKVFVPTKEFKAKSAFELTGVPYEGVLYAVSLCNLHDAWLSSIIVT